MQQSNVLSLALNTHFSAQKHIPRYETKHHNLKFLERNHQLCLLVKYGMKITAHRTKLCNWKKVNKQQRKKLNSKRATRIKYSPVPNCRGGLTSTFGKVSPSISLY